MQAKVFILYSLYSVQSPLRTCCVHGKSTGLRATLLWIKMGGSLWPISGRGVLCRLKFCAEPPVDVLCSQVQREIKGNITVD